jgi:hypothetical protein
MMIKATTTNPATRFCAMAAAPGELMNKATGANRGDQRRDRAPSRADHGARAERFSSGRAAKESTTAEPMAVQTCAALRKFAARSASGSLVLVRLAVVCGERDLAELLRGHGRACPGHPRLFVQLGHPARSDKAR